jgi:hypothetical protein
MKLLVKATLVLAMGATVLATPERAAAAPKFDDCWIIMSNMCGQYDEEQLCLAFCGAYDSQNAWCTDHSNTCSDPNNPGCGSTGADTLHCTGYIE